jgi:glycosyltransferase involved in cell wall biosynthesis
MPFFSVIIPAHERPALLLEAVDSVLQQTYPDFEVLVIYNDANSLPRSTFQDLRIRTFESKAHNRSAARNVGIHEAKGSYLCFLDDDDVYHQDLLQAFYDTLQRIGFPTDGVVRTGLLHCLPDHQLKAGAVFKEEVHDNVIKFVLQNMTGVVSCCIPAKLAKSFAFDERFQYWEDTHYLLRILFVSQLVQMPNHYYHYRYHPKMGSLDAGDLKEQCKSNLEAINDYYQNHSSEWTGKVPPKIFKSLMAQKLLMYAIRAAKARNKELAGNLFSQSLKESWVASSWKEYLSFLMAYLKG